MKVVLYHYTGNANIRAAAHGLMKENLLSEFHLAIASFPGSFMDSIGGIEPFSEIRRRRLDSALKPYVKTWPLREFGRHFALRTRLLKLTNHEDGIFSNDQVNWNIEKKVAAKLKYAAKNGAGAVYSSEDGAIATFREAKNLGLKCFYDLPIGYWRAMHRILAIEREKWPDWEPTLSNLNDSQSKLARKDEEISMADRIFVASNFTAKTLKEFPDPLPPIDIIPYGFPPIYTGENIYQRPKFPQPLKLLFVGSLTQRKGIANLFEAVKHFGKRIELTIVGNKTGGECKPLNEALSIHHWIPSLPQEEIWRLMRKSDVLIFPSLFEGFGLVITEAMSQGTPVITTDRTAGSNLINHGENGWMIDAGSTEAIQQIIEELLLKPETIADAGRKAMETAQSRPWARYGSELAIAIKRAFEKPSYNSLL
jgi:glycosyltransferase involved in cell wall biosynthesis